MAFDINQHLAAINPSAKKILNLPSDTIGKKMQDVFKDFPAFTSRFEKLTSTVNEFEIENPTLSGWLSIRVSPILDNKKKWYGQLILLEDITQKKQIEKILRSN